MKHRPRAGGARVKGYEIDVHRLVDVFVYKVGAECKDSGVLTEHALCM